MSRLQHQPKPRRKRVLLLFFISLLLAGSAWGSYALYDLRTRHNTRKLLVRAESAAAAEDWDNAAVAYRQYLQREIDDVNALQAYADVLFERVKTTPEVGGELVRALRRIVATQPNNTDALGKLAAIYLSVRDFGLAEEFASRRSALDPKSADAASVLATAQQGLNNNRQAADTLIAAIAHNLAESRLYAQLVILLTRGLDQPDEAAKWLGEALRVGETNVDVQLAAFLFHENQGKLDDAETHLRLALDLAPDSLTTLLPAGLYYLYHDRPDDAKAHLDHAADLDPENPRVLAVRAMWAKHTLRPDDLIATAEDFFQAAGDNHLGFLVQAAEFYLSAGQLRRTDECLAKIDGLPRAGERLETRMQLLKGTRAFQKGDSYAAIRHLQSASIGEPSSERILRLLAAARAQAGDLDGAANACRRLIRLAPAVVDARLRLAELAWKQGRFAEARYTIAAVSAASDAQKIEVDLMRLACDLGEAKRDSRSPSVRTESTRELKRLTSLAQQNPSATRWVVRCLVMTGQPKKAAELFRSHQGDAETSLRLGLELGRLLLSEGFHGPAMTLTGEILQQFPDAPQVYALHARAISATAGLSEGMAYASSDAPPAAARGFVFEAIADEYVDSGGLAQAVDLYRLAADLMESNVSVRRKIARYTADLDEAVQRSEEIRAIEGDTGLRWKLAQADALLRIDPAGESLTKARKLLQECVAARPRSPSARLLLGYTYELTGRFQDATEAYRMALTQDPTLRGTPAALRLVKLQYQMGRTTEADALLDSLFADYPDQPEVLRLRTDQQIRRRNYPSALATAERALKLQPTDSAWAVVTADLHLRTGAANKAEAIATEYLERTPESTTILWILARALMDQDRGSEAARRVLKATAAANDAPHHVLLARVLAHLDRNTEVADAITRAQTLAPHDATIWATCADLWGSINQPERQIASMRQAVNLRGEDPAESLAIARLLAARGTVEERAEANRIIMQRLTTNARDPNALVLRGQMAMQSVRPDPVAAENDLLSALAINPRLTDAHRLLGLVQLRLRRFDAARESINRGLALAPYDPSLLLASSQVHSALGDHTGAIRKLHKLLDISPRMPGALRLLASAYRASDQIDKGIAFIETHAQHDALNTGEIVVLAELFESKNDLERAAQLFRQAHEEDKSLSSVHQSLLRFLARRNNLDEIHTLAVARQREYAEDLQSWAMAGEMLGSQGANARLREVGMGWLANIAREHPDHAANATYRAALCHYGQSELPEAESKFLEALRLAPADGNVVNNLAWLYSEDLGRPADAVALIEEFLTAGVTPDAHLLDTHCVALIRLGRFDAAEQKARECLRIVGQNPTQTAATYRLGVALMKNGRTNEAIPHLRQAKKLNDKHGGLTVSEQEDMHRLLGSAPQRSSSDAPPSG